MINFSLFLVTDHPGPFAGKGLGSIGRGNRCAPFVCAAAATAASGMAQAAVAFAGIARRPGCMLRAHVGIKGTPLFGRGAGQPGRTDKHARRLGSAGGAGTGFVACGQTANGIEAPAARACIVIGWHLRAPGAYLTSGEIGIWMLPSSILMGPAAVGLMSNSKISVGNHKVAQALGTSTTPLI